MIRENEVDEFVSNQSRHTADIIARQRVYRTVRSILDSNGLLLCRIRPLFSNECLIHWHRKDKELRINVDIMAELSDDTIGRIVRSFL